MKIYKTFTTEPYSFLLNLTGEEMLPNNQKQIIEQGKFIYSPLGKAFEKQTKTNEVIAEK